MDRKAFLGKKMSLEENDKLLEDEIVAIDNEKHITKHTCIVGQSGSGKSVFLARYLEEIMLSKVGSVVFFDYNYEFITSVSGNEIVFTKGFSQTLSDLLQYPISGNMP